MLASPRIVTAEVEKDFVEKCSETLTAIKHAAVN